jgi:hypothetical protein
MFVSLKALLRPCLHVFVPGYVKRLLEKVSPQSWKIAADPLPMRCLDALLVGLHVGLLLVFFLAFQA